MKTIDRAQTLDWLSKRQLQDSSGSIDYPGSIQAVRSRIPMDSGRKTALSRVIASLFAEDEEALLWINEFGIWPSAEDWNLFDGFRLSLGEAKAVQERPGHLFSKAELKVAGSLIAMILYFCLGAVLVSTKRGLVIKISHDELIEVCARTQADASNAAEQLRDYLS
jgi:hypothetical protein